MTGGVGLWDSTDEAMSLNVGLLYQWRGREACVWERAKVTITYVSAANACFLLNFGKMLLAFC